MTVATSAPGGVHAPLFPALRPALPSLLTGTAVSTLSATVILVTHRDADIWQPPHHIRL